MEQEVVAGALLVQADTLKRVAAAALYEILGRMSYQADVSVRRLAAGMNLDEASLGQDFGAGGDRADDTVAVLAIGICIGGRLSVRAAFNPDVSAGACFCASDIQNRCLGQGMKDDSLDRVGTAASC